jgi:hypothetical protein
MFLVQRKCDLGIGLARELVSLAAQSISDLFISVQLAVYDRVDVTIFVVEWLFALGVQVDDR